MEIKVVFKFWAIKKNSVDNGNMIFSGIKMYPSERYVIVLLSFFSFNSIYSFYSDNILLP